MAFSEACFRLQTIRLALVSVEYLLTYSGWLNSLAYLVSVHCESGRVQGTFLADQSTISAPTMHAKAVKSLLPYLLPKSGSDQQPADGVEEVVGWDAIHVGAAAVKWHDELVRQLRSPGRLFIPVAEEENN